MATTPEATILAPLPDSQIPDEFRYLIPFWCKPFDSKRAPDGHPLRYKVAKGGRGSAKSQTMARLLIMRAMAGPEIILCGREYQNSIHDSSKAILEAAIDILGVRSQFYSTLNSIVCLRTGARFIFRGMHGQEQTIRSLEGVTIVWLDEAVTISQVTWDALDPTIRAEGAEIWISYNPRFASDPIDKVFNENPPPGSLVLTVNYYENPWFPPSLKLQMEHARATDPDKYAHVWLGEYLQRSDSKVFKRWWIRPFEAPEDAVFRFGADWGFSVDPTALVRAFIGRWAGVVGESEVIADHEGKCLFIDHEAYRVGVEIDDTPALFAGTDTQKPPRWDNPNGEPGVPESLRYEICADSARPETISYMQRRGFQITRAIKGPGSIEDGVEFLKAYDIYVHPRCGNVIDEMTLYSYAIDKLTNKVLPKLADKANNTIDALRYALESARRAGSGKQVQASTGTRTMIAKNDQIAAQQALVAPSERRPTSNRIAPATRLGIL